ncbi:MAG: hypothetical protein HY589_00650 [Candidatus Omnitrophica bacterium]|nr:hypothetical protein [Candidatus Omnitrophota bacterium]
MRHKIIQIISITLICAFASQGLAWGQTKGAALRPRAQGENNSAQSTGITLEQMLKEVRRMPEVRIVVAAADSGSALDGVNQFIARAGTAVRVWLVGDEADIKQVIRENNFTNLADIGDEVVMKENVIIVPAGKSDQLKKSVDCAINCKAHVLLKGNTQTKALMEAVTKHPRKRKLVAGGTIVVHGRYFQETPMGSVLYADGGVSIQENKPKDNERLALKEKVVRGTLHLAAACGMRNARVYLVVGDKEQPSRDLSDARKLQEKLRADLPHLEIATPEEVFVIKARGADGQGAIFIYPDINVNIIYKACDMRPPWGLEHIEDTVNAAGRLSVFKKIDKDGKELGHLVMTTPCPDADKNAKRKLLEDAIAMMKRYGINCPKIALLSFNEKIDEFEDVPSIEDNKYIIASINGKKIPCVIKQASWDIAMSAEAAAKKGEDDSVSDPDIIACPTHTIGTTLVHICRNYDSLELPWSPKIDTSWGCAATVAIPSRADKDKFPEIVMAAFMAMAFARENSHAPEQLDPVFGECVLRPRAAGEFRLTPGQADSGDMNGSQRQPVLLKLPFTPDFIYSLSPEVISNSEIDTLKLKDDFRDAMKTDGWEPKIGFIKIPEDLSNHGCNTYLLGRLKITVFKVSEHKSESGAVKLYAISNGRAVIGHGRLEYSPDTKIAIVTFSIHGGPEAPPGRNFRNKGYGTEALAATMAICANGFVTNIDQVRAFKLNVRLQNLIAIAQLYETPEEMKQAIDEYARLARLAKKCGFDEEGIFRMTYRSPRKILRTLDRGASRTEASVLRPAAAGESGRAAQSGMAPLAHSPESSDVSPDIPGDQIASGRNLRSVLEAI